MSAAKAQVVMAQIKEHPQESPSASFASPFASPPAEEASNDHYGGEHRDQQPPPAPLSSLSSCSSLAGTDMPKGQRQGNARSQEDDSDDSQLPPTVLMNQAEKQNALSPSIDEMSIEEDITCPVQPLGKSSNHRDCKAKDVKAAVNDQDVLKSQSPPRAFAAATRTTTWRRRHCKSRFSSSSSILKGAAMEASPARRATILKAALPSSTGGSSSPSTNRAHDPVRGTRGDDFPYQNGGGLYLDLASLDDEEDDSRLRHPGDTMDDDDGNDDYVPEGNDDDVDQHRDRTQEAFPIDGLEVEETDAVSAVRAYGHRRHRHHSRVSATAAAAAAMTTTSTIRRLSNTDVRAIFEALHHQKPMPGHLQVRIVSVGPQGLKLSPPSYEFEDGLYVLLRPQKKRPRGGSKGAAPSAVGPADPQPPRHLAHLLMSDDSMPPETCPWSLSGPQFPTPTAIQQRYCYPRGRDEYSSQKGGALWTMFGADGKEDVEYRLLHVYYSAKRAVNKGATSTASPGSSLPSSGSIELSAVVDLKIHHHRRRRASVSDVALAARSGVHSPPEGRQPSDRVPYSRTPPLSSGASKASSQSKKRRASHASFASPPPSKRRASATTWDGMLNSSHSHPKHVAGLLSPPSRLHGQRNHLDHPLLLESPAITTRSIDSATSARASSPSCHSPLSHTFDVVKVPLPSLESGYRSKSGQQKSQTGRSPVASEPTHHDGYDRMPPLARLNGSYGFDNHRPGTTQLLSPTFITPPASSTSMQALALDRSALFRRIPSGPGPATPSPMRYIPDRRHVHDLMSSPHNHNIRQSPLQRSLTGQDDASLERPHAIDADNINSRGSQSRSSSPDYLLPSALDATSWQDMESHDETTFENGDQASVKNADPTWYNDMLQENIEDDHPDPHDDSDLFHPSNCFPDFQRGTTGISYDLFETYPASRRTTTSHHHAIVKSNGAWVAWSTVETAQDLSAQLDRLQGVLRGGILSAPPLERAAMVHVLASWARHVASDPFAARPAKSDQDGEQPLSIHGNTGDRMHHPSGDIPSRRRRLREIYGSSRTPLDVPLAPAASRIDPLSSPQRQPLRASSSSPRMSRERQESAVNYSESKPRQGTVPSHRHEVAMLHPAASDQGQASNNIRGQIIRELLGKGAEV